MALTLDHADRDGALEAGHIERAHTVAAGEAGALRVWVPAP